MFYIKTYKALETLQVERIGFLRDCRAPLHFARNDREYWLNRGFGSKVHSTVVASLPAGKGREGYDGATSKVEESIKSF